MRFPLYAFTLLVVVGNLFAQDGSDMNYKKPADINSSYIGRWVHLDFGQRSFQPLDRTGRNRSLDTVTIEINGKSVQFAEHRVDDGYNNWFIDQFLETVKPIDGMSLRLTKNQILDVGKDFIKVRSYFD